MSDSRIRHLKDANLCFYVLSDSAEKLFTTGGIFWLPSFCVILLLPLIITIG